MYPAMAGPSNEKDLDVNKYKKDDSLEPSKLIYLQIKER